MKIKLLLFLLVLFSSQLFSQTPGMQFFHTHDGLPSDEVYKSLIDDKGYLWFATNNGVCYFDGETFTTLDINDGLTENTILEIEKDRFGRIWFAGISGLLSYYENGKVHHFKGNDIIKTLKNSVEIIASGTLYPFDTNEVVFSLTRGKMIHIKGDKFELYNINRGDSVCISKPDDQHLFYSQYNKNKDSVITTAIIDGQKIELKYRCKNTADILPNRNLYIEFPDKVIYFTDSQAFTFHKDGRILTYPIDYTPLYAIKGILGGIWVGSVDHGLMFYRDESLASPPHLSFLEDQCVTSLRYDQNTRGWVTTLLGGVHHVQSLYITNYSAGGNFIANYISQILKVSEERFIGVSRTNKIFILDGLKSKLQKIEIPALEREIVNKAKIYHGNLYLSSSAAFYEIPINTLFQNKSRMAEAKRYPFTNGKDFVIQDSILWFATSTGLLYCEDFFSIENKKLTRLENTKNLRMNKISSYIPPDKEEGFSYLLFQDMNNLRRLRYLKDNPQKAQLSELHFINQDKYTTSNTFITPKNSEDVIIGTKGRGLFWVKTDTVFIFNESSGLLSNNIQVLKQLNDSTIYLGTNKGINIVEFSIYKYPVIKSSKIIKKNDGLMGSDIHDLKIVKNNHLLAATDRGLSLINLPIVLSMEDKFPIYIDEFMVNGENRFQSSIGHFELEHYENNIEIGYNAIDFHDKKNITYYYRITDGGNEEWEKIKRASVVMPYMPAGNYTFEVKGINSYGYESDNIDSISFSIKKVFYDTWFFKILVSFSILALLGAIFYFYYSKRNERLQNEKVLADFHQQSLTRVMNPHFMFNALNSVNSYIVNNRTNDATYFVKQIGDLIRQIFNSAYHKEITLEKEVKLLNSYLSLEQRRSNSYFNFIIKLESDLEQFTIPSIMIQIFAENSIIHGFSDLKIRGALLLIQFKKVGELVECIILDNGIGRKKAMEFKTEKSNKRELHGLKVIEERIKLLNIHNSKQKILFEVIDLQNHLTREAKGTKVILKFPYQRGIKLIGEQEKNL
ncbi:MULTISPECIES: sensor histidine kinase [unclassified Lentimicrobium]|uniref:sensor histidine kinase n=1 Tax=unclassified Lentimicrobium TaxID=2677434 RepID=UPI00155497E6|nr:MULTISPECIES: sensor histidine kinase [unclassified Lentimicrobium]NPD47210.1 histidine kinase [Lentimicrobium sp. S6]NPD84867.1 histidine kinase [Lentimicrobium sp. L6]